MGGQDLVIPCVGPATCFLSTKAPSACASVLALESRTHATGSEDHDQVPKPARWCPLHSYWLTVAFKHYLQQEFLGDKRKLLVELFSLSLTHACKLVPLLFFNKNFLVRKENCLLRDSPTNFILLSATSSLFHHPFKCANTTKCKCVSIFLTIFQGLITHLDTPLDPSIDAKLYHSSGTR